MPVFFVCIRFANSKLFARPIFCAPNKSAPNKCAPFFLRAQSLARPIKARPIFLTIFLLIFFRKKNYYFQRFSACSLATAWFASLTFLQFCSILQGYHRRRVRGRSAQSLVSVAILPRSLRFAITVFATLRLR